PFSLSIHVPVSRGICNLPSMRPHYSPLSIDCPKIPYDQFRGARIALHGFAVGLSSLHDTFGATDTAVLLVFFRGDCGSHIAFHRGDRLDLPRLVGSTRLFCTNPRVSFRRLVAQGNRG